MKFTFLNTETAAEVILWNLDMTDVAQTLEDGLVLVSITSEG